MKLFHSFPPHACLMLLTASIGCSAAWAHDQIDFGESPGGSGEVLVLRTIASARQSIRLAGYSFTSPSVVRELVRAKKNGVDVAVVVDYRNNFVENRSGKPQAALGALVAAGIPTRTVSAYPLQHSKYMLIDNQTIETGSYNYTEAAARYNSENVWVIHDRPDLAAPLLRNWNTLYQQGSDFRPGY